MTRLTRIALALGAIAALAVPLAASASGGKQLTDDDRHRVMFATDTRATCSRSGRTRRAASARRRSPACPPASR